VFRSGDRVFERKGASSHCTSIIWGSAPLRPKEERKKLEGKEEIKKERGGAVRQRKLIKEKCKRRRGKPES
jgi:hypothetical protein